MSKLENLIKIIEVEAKRAQGEVKEPLDSLLYDTILKTLVEMDNNFKDDFTEQVVINFLISGDDEGYSTEDLEFYVQKEIKK